MPNTSTPSRRRRSLTALAAVVLAVAAWPAAAAAADPVFRVVALGDSYASGEGAPQRPGQHNNSGQVTGVPNEWDIEVPAGSAAYLDADDCHRSPLAGAAVAARRLAAEFPGVAVSFRSFACSGAQVREGLLRAYDFRTPDSGARLRGEHVVKPAQIEQLAALQRSLGANRTVDAVVVNAGGNDANFAGIVKRCFRIPPFVDNCNRQGTLDHFNEGLATLDDRFDRLARSLQRTTQSGSGDPEVEQPPRSVLLTGVPNFANGADNAPCDNDRTDDNLVDNLTADESRFVGQQIFAPLVDRLERSATEHGWTFLPVAHRFRGHGICAPAGTNFINTNLEAVHQQGEDSKSSGFPGLAISSGFAHPNQNGYAAYAEVILPALRAQLKQTFTPGLASRAIPDGRAVDPATGATTITFRFSDSGTVGYPTVHQVQLRRPDGGFMAFKATEPGAATVQVTLPAPVPPRFDVASRVCGAVAPQALCPPFVSSTPVVLQAPPAPANVRAIPGRPESAPADDGSPAVTVTWAQAADADVRSFRVTASARGLRPVTKVVTPRFARATVLDGLQAGTDHEVRVEACGDFDCSPASAAPGVVRPGTERFASSVTVDSPLVGLAGITPRHVRARGRTVRLRLAWEHPDNWNELASLELRMRRGKRILGRVRLGSPRPGVRRLTASGAVGIVRGEVPKPGPTARRVTLPLTLRLATATTGRRLALDLAARDRFGRRQVARGIGTLRGR